MKLNYIETFVKKLSTISDNKYGTNYISNFKSIEEDGNKTYKITTTFENTEDRKNFGEKVLKPIENRFEVKFHQYTNNFIKKSPEQQIINEIFKKLKILGYNKMSISYSKEKNTNKPFRSGGIRNYV